MTSASVIIPLANGQYEINKKNVHPLPTYYSNIPLTYTDHDLIDLGLDALLRRRLYKNSIAAITQYIIIGLRNVDTAGYRANNLLCDCVSRSAKVLMDRHVQPHQWSPEELELAKVLEYAAAKGYNYIIPAEMKFPNQSKIGATIKDCLGNEIAAPVSYTFDELIAVQALIELSWAIRL